MTRQEVKQALISIMIGSLVSFLTVLMQGLIVLLQNIPTEAPGGVSAAVYYLVQAARHGFLRYV
jgi:hypothetical protein